MRPELVWAYQGFAHKLCPQVHHERLITANGTQEPYVQRFAIALCDLGLSLDMLARLYPCTVKLEDNIVEKKGSSSGSD